MKALSIIQGKSGLYLTLVFIIIYWFYILWLGLFSTTPFPETLQELIITLLKIKLFYLVLIFLLLRLVGERFRDVGLVFGNWPRQVLNGLGFGIAIWVFVHVVLNTALKIINPIELRNVISISKYIQDFDSLIIWFMISIFGGGLVEELQRAFVLTRFKKWRGNSTLYFSLGISSILFGLNHLYQGTNMAISAGISGLLFGLVFLRRGSLLEAICCHSLYDIIGVTISYGMR